MTWDPPAVHPESLFSPDLDFFLLRLHVGRGPSLTFSDLLAPEPVPCWLCLTSARLAPPLPARPAPSCLAPPLPPRPALPGSLRPFPPRSSSLPPAALTSYMPVTHVELTPYASDAYGGHVYWDGVGGAGYCTLLDASHPQAPVPRLLDSSFSVLSHSQHPARSSLRAGPASPSPRGGGLGERAPGVPCPRSIAPRLWLA